jgi:repressor LexA
MPTQTEIDRAATRRKQTLKLIATSISTHGYPPSVSELATATGVSSAAVRRDLEALEKAGKIERDFAVARGIRIKADLFAAFDG